jgi:hypothetical protein
MCFIWGESTSCNSGSAQIILQKVNSRGLIASFKYCLLVIKYISGLIVGPAHCDEQSHIPAAVY